MHSICVKKAQNAFQLRQNFYSLQTCTYFVIKKLIGKNIETHRSLFSKNVKTKWIIRRLEPVLNWCWRAVMLAPYHCTKQEAFEPIFLLLFKIYKLKTVKWPMLKNAFHLRQKSSKLIPIASKFY